MMDNSWKCSSYSNEGEMNEENAYHFYPSAFQAWAREVISTKYNYFEVDKRKALETIFHQYVRNARKKWLTKTEYNLMRKTLPDLEACKRYNRDACTDARDKCSYEMVISIDQQKQWSAEVTVILRMLNRK